MTKASRGLRKVLDHLYQTLPAPYGNAWTDGQLLTRFVTSRDEVAFSTLVRRHGPMVLNVCHRVLRDSHDVEDAFQATFLVLTRKAGAVVKREAVGSWLYGVACRIAHRSQVLKARRQAREK